MFLSVGRLTGTKHLTRSGHMIERITFYLFLIDIIKNLVPYVMLLDSSKINIICVLVITSQMILHDGWRRSVLEVSFRFISSDVTVGPVSVEHCVASYDGPGRLEVLLGVSFIGGRPCVSPFSNV